MKQEGYLGTWSRWSTGQLGNNYSSRKKKGHRSLAQDQSLFVGSSTKYTARSRKQIVDKDSGKTVNFLSHLGGAKERNSTHTLGLKIYCSCHWIKPNRFHAKATNLLFSANPAG